MNFSWPFIRRPIGTTLLAIGLFLTGAVAYDFLPVSSLPSVSFPTISVSASYPGADPNTMAATVAAPLERRLGEISGVTELTSTSSQGTSRINIQFDLSRNVDSAARDVQAAINAALSDLPSDLPSVPTFRKANPAAAPILILALTSKTLPGSAIYDAADTVIAQRLSQVEGVAEVSVAGSEQPAIRVRVDPDRIAGMGVTLEQIRNAIRNANAQGPLGSFDGTQRAVTIGINDQLRLAPEYDPLVVRTVDGNVVRLSDVARITPSVRNTRSAGWYNRDPSVLLIITKQGDANVIDTVDRIYALLPELKQWIPAGLDIHVLTDRTQTIRASVEDMQLTLAASAVLVMLVVFLFLRRAAATIAAGVTVPLCLAGTCGAMWLAGFSIDNLSLMALAVSIGFVVDDAIVMIENMFRFMEQGHRPLRAAMMGARQISFTVVSISVSLIAAFIPLLFMGGIVGRLFREFSVTLAFSIAVSTVVSLSVTPMICAYFVRKPPDKSETWLDRRVESLLSLMLRFYDRTLLFVLAHRVLTLIVFFATIALTVGLFIKTPKGYFPQDDTGLIFGGTQASTDISYEAMEKLQLKALDVVLADPAVAGVGSSVGASGFNASVNRGRLFISLKPLEARNNVPTQAVIARLRNRIGQIPGLRVFLVPAQDLRAGARSSDSSYQFTLWSADIDALQAWVPKVVERVQKIPQLTDVTTDREQGGLQVNIKIDRSAAARLGVRIQDIDSALNNSYSQRQVSTIYTQRNQYRVILEVAPQFRRDPSDLSTLYVPGNGNAQIPLSAVATVERGIAPLVVNHQGQFPSVTITYNIKEGVPIADATAALTQAVAEMHMPDSIRTDFAGDVKAFKQSAGAQPLLLLSALIAVYIVLGVLYESLVHPLTIISTLPSAGLGALLALQVSGAELTVIAFIGVILLIGIVKKNGIMMVDFALEGERVRGLPPVQAIYEACLARFRPILMTTLAAILGAVPLVVASGPGSELRRPLGITIIGGLIVSQILTLYTTPVIYLWLDRLHHRLGGGLPSFVKRRPRGPQAPDAPSIQPAE
ncbi:MAG: efflux RND transporter permease subunit [Proteobacteria bacterium]|nr:efflux RND transporter permease subunit [Pseudomonadota bacterium]